MAGPRHLSRLNAPHHWMLDKMGGSWAPRPTAGPHALRSCLPLVLILRNRLHLATTYHEAEVILNGRDVLVDGKVRTDATYPAGFMDVVSMPKANTHYRLLYDSKGRFCLHKITAAESKYKLCKVRKFALGAKGIPYVSTHDGRTIRFADSSIHSGDTIKVDVTTGAISEHIPFQIGCVAMVSGGKSAGRVGTVTVIEKHDGAHTFVHLKDSRDDEFITTSDNVFVIGRDQPLVTLPAQGGVKLTDVEDRELRLKKSH